jgi:hypothetical protein
MRFPLSPYRGVCAVRRTRADGFRARTDHLKRLAGEHQILNGGYQASSAPAHLSMAGG